MHIGIEDRGYHSLVRQLVAEGHKVTMYVPGIPYDLLWPWEGVTYATSRSDLVNAEPDFIISSDFPDGNVRAAALMAKIPVIGHDSSAIELELDRELAFSVIKSLGLPNIIRVPDVEQFTNKADAINFLKHSKRSWVMKQHRDSPLDESDNRTVISKAKSKHAYAIQLLEAESSPWFNGEVGGVRFEQFVEGVEVCWGSMFSHSSPTYPIYWCQEYKDAQNGGRSGVLTGEVGTILGVVPNNRSAVASVFETLGMRLRGSGILTTGMIDFNTIIDVKTGIMYFIEFTVRWGRPTLELQIAMSSPSKNMGRFLKNVAGGRGYHFPYHWKTGLGVTVYDYGLPFVLSAPGRKPIPFKPPVAKSPVPIPGERRSSGRDVVPLFANCSNPKEWNSSASEGRHFVSVGLSSFGIDDSVKLEAVRDTLVSNAYGPLSGFNASGMTWRDDIGHNALDVIDAVRRVA